MNSDRAETYIVQQLRQGLAPALTYHGVHHTLDVVEAAAKLADAEAVVDPESLALLRTAAFYHDAGFLTTYAEHEQAGCTLARQTLPNFGYSPDQVEQVCGMIMATRIPQMPQTQLEEILCDADLDYLGRLDFDPIARTLFTELAALRGLTDERTWNKLQVSFLEAHHYWTATAIAQREAAKQVHLEQLRKIVSVENY